MVEENKLYQINMIMLLLSLNYPIEVVSNQNLIVQSLADMDEMAIIRQQGPDTISCVTACSLVRKKLHELNYDMDIQDLGFIGTINDSLLKLNKLIIYQPSHSNGPTAGQTAIIHKNSEVTIFALDPEKNFNAMMISENICVNSYDVAVEIAKLFIRMISPMISHQPTYFLDELTDSSYNQFIEHTTRNEIKIHKNSKEVKLLYEWMLKNVIHKKLMKKKWFTQVAKRAENYIVDILTTGEIEIRHDFGYYVEPPMVHRTLHWHFIIFPNGTISAILPRKLKVFTIYDKQL